MHHQPHYHVVDFCWNQARPDLMMCVGEQGSSELSFGSGVLSIFQPNRLLLMDEQEAANELARLS